MKFLVELDHVKTGQPLNKDSARAFVEGIIFPTIDRARQLAKEGRIVAGGPVVGRVALRFIADVESPQKLDQLVTSLPLWTVAETRVTPLMGFNDRRTHIQALLDRIMNS